MLLCNSPVEDPSVNHLRVKLASSIKMIIITRIETNYNFKPPKNDHCTSLNFNHIHGRGISAQWKCNLNLAVIQESEGKNIVAIHLIRIPRQCGHDGEVS